MDRDIGYALGIASHIHIYLHIACRITHSYLNIRCLSIQCRCIYVYAYMQCTFAVYPFAVYASNVYASMCMDAMCMHLCNLAVLVPQAHACMQCWRACVTARDAEQECERQETQRKRRVYGFVMDEDMR